VQFVVEVGVVRRGGPPLPVLRGQQGGKCLLERFGLEVSPSESKFGDLVGCVVQVLMPIPKPTGFTGADPYKM
jgi:hypothetical protein